MPHPIPTDRVLPIAVKFVARRQIDSRPTTVRQMSKRVGLGGYNLLGWMEEAEGLKFHLVVHGDDPNPSLGNQEIFFEKVPEYLLLGSGISPSAVRASFERVFPDGVQPVEPQLPFDLPEQVFEESPELSPRDEIDPYARYRIDRIQFETMRPHLLPIKKFIEEAEKKGYTASSILRACGGDRMKFNPVNPDWRPYVYRKARYYLKDLLNRLDESFDSYQDPKVGRERRQRRLAKLASEQ